jgi:hypothetical protein
MNIHIVKSISKLILIVLLAVSFFYKEEIKVYLSTPNTKISPAVSEQTPVEPKNEEIQKGKIDIVKQLKSRIYLSGDIPGYIIKENIGLLCRSFLYYGENNFRLSFKDALDGLETDMDSNDAHALIDFRIFSSTAEQQGSKWSHSVNFICGDMVILEVGQ